MGLANPRSLSGDVLARSPSDNLHFQPQCPYPFSAPATVASLLAAELVSVPVATVLLLIAAVAVRDVDPGAGVVLVVVVVAVAAAPLEVVHLQLKRYKLETALHLGKILPC